MGLFRKAKPPALDAPYVLYSRFLIRFAAVSGSFTSLASTPDVVVTPEAAAMALAPGHRSFTIVMNARHDRQDRQALKSFNIAAEILERQMPGFTDTINVALVEHVRAHGGFGGWPPSLEWTMWRYWEDMRKLVGPESPGT